MADNSYSYSQCGEDRIVKFIFAALQIHFPNYLDIGTYHPIQFSNTYLFYQMGCSGVCIEPDPELFDTIRGARPRDICINAGIGVVEAENIASFYIMTARTLNTFSESEAQRIAMMPNQFIEKVIPLPLINANSVLQSHFSQGINFISIDVEGLDLEVLQSIDFMKYRPEVVCIETLSYSESNNEEKETQAIGFMHSKGYMVYADTYINTIFVREDAWRSR